MKWVYYDYMGKDNPVCEDVGEIQRIFPNLPAAPYTYSRITEIETDVGLFGCDTKYKIMLYGGYCFFEPIRGKNGKTKQKTIDLAGIKHGEEVDLDMEALYLMNGAGLTPITTDPRILCIMHRAHGLNDPEKQLPELCKRIPTRDEAVAYLRAIGAQMECLPECAVKQKLNNERN